MSYGKNLLIACSQLGNVLLAGWPDETLSSRLYRWHRDGKRSWPMRMLDAVFFWEKDHCKMSFLSEVLGTQSPRELRRE
jgi:hypothetical protein